jgi:hypothetical protein
MGVFPAAKRPGDHDITKHTPWFAISVLGRPGLQERPDAKSNLHSRPRLFYGASAFNDAGIFPRRSELRKRVRPGVPGVNNIRGGGHLTAINK